MCLFWCVNASVCVSQAKIHWMRRGGVGPSRLGHKEEPVAPLGNHSSCLHLKYPCEVSISG